MYNQSFAGSYGNAARMRDLLGDQDYLDKNKISNENAALYDQALRAQQGQAVAGGIITGLTGATTLLSNAFKDAQIRDTSMQENQIADLSRAGAYNYNNYDQLANDYAQTNFGGPNISYQDIRGMSTGEQIGSVGTSTLSGAMTGLQIGGPWGALAGGVIGLGTGLGGVLTGNASARAKQQQLNLETDLAADAAHRNFAAAHERIGDNIHRQNAVNAVKNGGPISRQQSIKEYAENVLRKGGPMRRERKPSNVQRIMTNGGCVYRVKIK